MRTAAARILGAATFGYGAAILWRPTWLTGPCRLPDGAAQAALTRAIGSRDALIGAAMLVAPPSALRAVVATRTAVDFGDALVFGSSLPSRPARAKAAAVALTWACLCAWTLADPGAPQAR
ncbi:hypothetical protein ACGFXC_26475 [Streptomyces sp. NPDC048507]|uniref:hypothetical protein n=1 Tax=Streptomyces sp. NPDC048507 TaxID=3365560 RepID=UPI0037148C7A